MRTTVGLFIPARCGSFSFLPQRAFMMTFQTFPLVGGKVLRVDMESKPRSPEAFTFLSLWRAYHLENITRLEGE